LGLGLRLLEDFEKSLYKISINPLSFGLFDSYHRKARMKKFPFIIFFEVLENEIIISRIRHAKRDNSFLFP
jgi:plasmid stabilization system protein ParE